jgi:hypothetical protein
MDNLLRRRKVQTELARDSAAVQIQQLFPGVLIVFSGQREPAPSSPPRTRCTVHDQQTVFCWAPIPFLVMVISSVAFFHYLTINNLVDK